MQSKSLLIAVAAFAVTTTGVHAYGESKILEKANLTEDQISALEEAREFRSSGDMSSARDLLLEAGIDEEVLRSIHKAKREVNSEVRKSVEEGDYETFTAAIEGGPLADIINSEADFERFREAHELRRSGEKEEAREILEELGIERMGGKHHLRGKIMSQLSDDQKDAVQVARQANDKEAVRAILMEAGVERPLHHD